MILWQVNQQLLDSTKKHMKKKRPSIENKPMEKKSRRATILSLSFVKGIRSTLLVPPIRFFKNDPMTSKLTSSSSSLPKNTCKKSEQVMKTNPWRRKEEGPPYNHSLLSKVLKTCHPTCSTPPNPPQPTKNFGLPISLQNLGLSTMTHLGEMYLVLIL